MPDPTAFVTGATGFVGGALCAELRTRGWTVTALARRPEKAGHLARTGAQVAAGDILDAGSLARALPRDVDTVFHVAGDTSLWHKRDDRQTRINVDGTRNVIAAARAAGARRFIQTSTISAYGRQPGTIDETTPSTAAGSRINYERSKWLGEQLVREAVATGLDAVILQPAAIIGPGDTSSWGRLFRVAQAGKLNFLPPGALPANHVDQIVAAHIAAAERGRRGESYLLGGDTVQLADLVRGIFELLGRRPPGVVAPAGLLKVVGTVLGAVTPSSVGEPLLTREMAVLMSTVATCDSSKAGRELGLRPVPLAQSLSDCHRWLVEQKLL